MIEKTRRGLLLPGKALAYLKRYGLRATLINADNRTLRLQARLERIWVRLEQKGVQFRSTQKILNSYRKFYTGLTETAAGQNQVDFVPLSDTDLSGAQLPVKLIAFYLPQFHPFPENDAWWGRGFTEWTNVSKAVPQFVGHYQPHLPGELGFYDLRVPEVQVRQVELARKYGIQGFCFYYYWFDGKRLLERPLNSFLSDPRIDFPFCLCWANENWTRRWDGQENDILIAQNHSPESDRRFMQDMLPIFQNKRYIRVDGRPLLIVYRADILPDVHRTVETWRNACLKAGEPDPYLVAAQSFGFEDPRTVGFDAAVEFPPHTPKLPAVINHQLEILNPEYSGYIMEYSDFAVLFGRDTKPPGKLFKTVVPSWDNEARKPGRGAILTNSSPAIYQDWLEKVIRITVDGENDPDKHLVFINAWNEWAEGTHLEPDRRYGYAYLEATARALQSFRPEGKPERQELSTS